MEPQRDTRGRYAVYLNGEPIPLADRLRREPASKPWDGVSTEKIVAQRLACMIKGATLIQTR